MSHIGSLAGNDVVFDAAFRRAGIIRVNTVGELFNCAQALAMQPRPQGNRLAIVTNAGGPGVLATDHLVANGGELAVFQPKTIEKLNAALKEGWSHGNPVDVIGDAPAAYYEEATRICLQDSGVDAVLVIYSPQPITKAEDVAEKIVKLAKKHKKTMLASWMGERNVEAAQEVLEAGKIPNYRYPEDAIEVFLKMYEHQRILKLLYETPAANPLEFEPDRKGAASIVENALAEGRTQLSEDEAPKLMQCYNILVGAYKVVNDTEEAVAFATQLGFPVVMKIASPDIAHKTEVNGVRLNIHDPYEVRETFMHLISSVRRQRPNARINGIIIEKMISKPFELLLGAKTDPNFGPVVIFGKGGTAVEIYRDYHVGLPPLNMALAQHIVSRTRIFPLLEGYRGMKGVDLDQLQALLCNFSYLVMDFPEIQEIDINPFVMDEFSGVALDAHIMLNEKPKKAGKPFEHLVILPYPAQFTKTVTAKNGKKVLLRPIRPEDEPMEMRMLQHVSRQSLYYRFLWLCPEYRSPVSVALYPYRLRPGDGHHCGSRRKWYPGNDWSGPYHRRCLERRGGICDCDYRPLARSGPGWYDDRLYLRSGKSHGPEAHLCLRAFYQ
jgi:acetyltransferase